MIFSLQSQTLLFLPVTSHDGIPCRCIADRPPLTEKIYIAAAFYNNEAVLPYWSQSMLSAIRYLGPENVFVSIVESYSQDKTPELLRQ